MLNIHLEIIVIHHCVFICCVRAGFNCFQKYAAVLVSPWSIAIDSQIAVADGWPIEPLPMSDSGSGSMSREGAWVFSTGIEATVLGSDVFAFRNTERRETPKLEFKNSTNSDSVAIGQSLLVVHTCS